VCANKHDQYFFPKIIMCFKKPEFDADFKTAKSSDANASERKVKEVVFLTFNLICENYCKFLNKNEKKLLKKFI
jgi:hypothetical protein